MERGGILLHAQVNQAQVVEDLPVEGRQVVGSLQTGDGRHELLLPEETHPDIVPQRGRLRYVLDGHFVLGEGHVVVLVSLHHGAGCQDGPPVAGIESQGSPETLKGCL